MNNADSNNEFEKVYKFSPEFSGMKSEFMPIASIFMLGLITKFIPNFVDLSMYKILNYNLGDIDKSYFKWASIVIIIIAIIKLIKFRFKLKSTKYTLTPQRLTVEKGIFSKNISNLELWRVVDIQIKQNFSQVSMGGCTIELITQDVSDPVLHIDGLPIKKGKEMYDIINKYVNHSVKHSGVMRTL